MDVLENLPPAVTLVLALLLLVWLVLLLLVPFMIESIRSSARKTYVELEALNEKLDRLIALLGARGRETSTQNEGPVSDAGARGEERPRGGEHPRAEERPRVEERPRAERIERARKEPTISG